MILFEFLLFLCCENSTKVSDLEKFNQHNVKIKKRLKYI